MIFFDNKLTSFSSNMSHFMMRVGEERSSNSKLKYTYIQVNETKTDKHGRSGHISLVFTTMFSQMYHLTTKTVAILWILLDISPKRKCHDHLLLFSGFLCSFFEIIFHNHLITLNCLKELNLKENILITIATTSSIRSFPRL